MDATKDCLVVVHASDKWLNSNLEPSEVKILKNAIKNRIEDYISLGKAVFYTPFVGNDKQLPTYFPVDNNITSISVESEGQLPCLFLLKFQAIVILKKLLENDIRTIELCGVQENACVKGTKRAFKEITNEDVKKYTDFTGEPTDYIKYATSRNIDTVINRGATDSILWNSKRI